CVNCFNDDGKMHIVANNHGLPAGALHIDFYSYLPNSLYPDGTERVMQPIDVDIELVAGAADDAEGGEAEVVIPYALVTSYDIAKTNGYGGTAEEYNEALTRLPQLKAEVDNVNELAEVIEAHGAAAQAAAEAAQAQAAQAAEQAEAAASAQQAQELRLAAVESEAAALTEGKQDKLRSSDDVLVEGDILRIADIAKKKVFIDMWNAACDINGKKWGWYDAEADDFLLYPDFRGGEGLHLTYEQAVKCYVVSKKGIAPEAAKQYRGSSGAIALLPLRLSSQYSSELFSSNGSIRACALLEATGENPFVCKSSATSMFIWCKNLEEIYGEFSIEGGTAQIFGACGALREVRVYSAKVGFSVQYSPLLSLASFQYMLTRPDNTTAITITVHPNCYAKMIGDTTNAAAAALTEEEAAQWQQLLTDAAAKNITFATV
ncbi:MAG: hypothetical protein ACI30W_02280, partial [Muribaculaceae bacterium]